MTKNNKLLKLKEQKQNSEIAINDEAKKRIDKLIKCRQIEVKLSFCARYTSEKYAILIEYLFLSS